MKVEYEIDSSGKYVCSCGDFTGSRSGWYKHKAVKHSPPKVEEEIIPEPVVNDEVEVEVDIEETTPSSSWTDFDSTASEIKIPSSMPTPLKALHKKSTAKKGTKRTKEEIASLRDTSKSITMLGLTFGDSALSVWGRGVLLDPEFKIERNERDKEITADAVVGAMEERGVYLAENISRTAVATIMLGWYFGVPTYKISKKAERGLFKGGKIFSIFGRIPPFRWFRRKKKVKAVEQVVQ